MDTIPGRDRQGREPGARALRGNPLRPRLPLAGWIAVLLGLLAFSAALAYPPDQADQGATVYTERCSTCHGDVAQGLTEEFRMTWAAGDRNCWVPGCHGGNPGKPGGFTLPRYVPALAGPGTLAKFPNAQALHDFVKAAMPMQEPGVLPDDQYWAVTAFLLRANGMQADGQPLDATTARDVAVPKSGQPVPVPQRTPGVVPPMSARDRVAMPKPTHTPQPQALAVAQQANVAQARGAADTGLSAARAAALARAGLGNQALVWLIALALVLAGAIILARLRGSRARRRSKAPPVDLPPGLSR